MAFVYVPSNITKRLGVVCGAGDSIHTHIAAAKRARNSQVWWLNIGCEVKSNEEQ